MLVPKDLRESIGKAGCVNETSLGNRQVISL